MKYGAEMISRVIKELEKVPNIRHVCNKVGIDHSTFYRWLMFHPTFNKKVIVALFIGRRAISGAAETVIIKGVQNGEYRCATFWLSHNDPQYMLRDKGAHYGMLMDRDIKIVDKPVYKDETNFERLFKALENLEKEYEPGVSKRFGQILVESFCGDDKELIDVFYAAYADWKNRSRKGDIGGKKYP